MKFNSKMSKFNDIITKKQYLLNVSTCIVNLPHWNINNYNRFIYYIIILNETDNVTKTNSNKYNLFYMENIRINKLLT